MKVDLNKNLLFFVNHYVDRMRRVSFSNEDFEGIGSLKAWYETLFSHILVFFKTFSLNISKSKH